MATLEEALAGVRRGERWEQGDWHLAIERNAAFMHKSGWATDPMVCPWIDGWVRVEEPLRCPACGDEMMLVKDEPVHPWGKPWRTGCSCGVRGPFASSEPAAREAWERIGGKR